MAASTRSVQFGATTIPFVLHRSRARRTAAITVNPNSSVRVVAPPECGEDLADTIVRSRASWILQQWDEQRRRALPCRRAYWVLAAGDTPTGSSTPASGPGPGSGGAGRLVQVAGAGVLARRGRRVCVTRGGGSAWCVSDRDEDPLGQLYESWYSVRLAHHDGTTETGPVHRGTRSVPHPSRRSFQSLLAVT